jgi:acetyl-CoA/propionyl-CoA carboxylase biotin carboxyl carrier protein
MFRKVLIANRGEIAVRVAQTLREMGIQSVGVYTADDADSLHLAETDQAVLLDGTGLSETYLSIPSLVDAALSEGADAIHPGYGFLAESAEFARACEQAGIVFIGPSAEVIEKMGSKTRAREIMSQAGVPVVPGETSPIRDLTHLNELATGIGYPLVLKAVSGGGGRGFRIVREPSELERAWKRVTAEALRYFRDGRVYVERLIENARHVEVQILADNHGNVVHLFDRDCTVQRRQQKLVEEAPAPGISAELRLRITEIALLAARTVGYRSLGTVEGLLQGDNFYFLEMNTRIQVEHPVTEMITGIDLVAEQIKVAGGAVLGYSQEDIGYSGHSIECRINAEDASRGFLPTPGQITGYREPLMLHVRIDSGVSEGSRISPLYDSLIAKLIVWAPTRAEATEKMKEALDAFAIEGVPTLIPFHRHLLGTAEWRRGESCTNIVGDAEWLSELTVE